MSHLGLALEMHLKHSWKAFYSFKSMSLLPYDYFVGLRGRQILISYEMRSQWFPPLIFKTIMVFRRCFPIILLCVCECVCVCVCGGGGGGGGGGLLKANDEN